jgi:hypothetical protein
MRVGSPRPAEPAQPRAPRKFRESAGSPPTQESTADVTGATESLACNVSCDVFPVDPSRVQKPSLARLVVIGTVATDGGSRLLLSFLPPRPHLPPSPHPLSLARALSAPGQAYVVPYAIEFREHTDREIAAHTHNGMSKGREGDRGTSSSLAALFEWVRLGSAAAHGAGSPPAPLDRGPDSGGVCRSGTERACAPRVPWRLRA